MTQPEAQPYDRMCEALERIAGCLDTLAALIASNQPVITPAAVTTAAPQQASVRPGFRQRVDAPPQQQRRGAPAQSNRKPVEVWEENGSWFIECPFHQVREAKVFDNKDGTITVKCGERFKGQDGTQRYCASSRVVDA